MNYSGSMVSRRGLLALAASASCGCVSRSGDAPDFSGRTIYGEYFSRDRLKGRPVLVQFWATWCGYRRRDQPDVESIAREFSGRLTVLAVSVREPRMTVSRYLAQFPRTSKIVLSEDTNLVDAFEPGGFPHYFLLDASGRQTGEQRGAAGMPGLRHLLQSAGL